MYESFYNILSQSLGTHRVYVPTLDLRRRRLQRQSGQCQLAPQHPERDRRRATDQALADALGIDLGHDSTDIDKLQSLVSDPNDEVPPPVSSVLELLVAIIDSLQERVTELEENLEQTHDVATTAVGDAATTEHRLDKVETQQEATHDVAKSAIAKAQQPDAEGIFTTAERHR